MSDNNVKNWMVGKNATAYCPVGMTATLMNLQLWLAAQDEATKTTKHPNSQH